MRVLKLVRVMGLTHILMDVTILALVLGSGLWKSGRLGMRHGGLERAIPRGHGREDNLRKHRAPRRVAKKVDIGLVRPQVRIPGSHGGIPGPTTITRGTTTMKSQEVGPTRLWLQISVVKKTGKVSKLGVT